MGLHIRLPDKYTRDSHSQWIWYRFSYLYYIDVSYSYIYTSTTRPNTTHIACQCLPSRRICVPSWKYKWRRLWSHFCLYWNWWTIIQMYGKHKKNTWVSLNLAFVFRRRTEYYNFCESNVSFHHHKRHCKVLGHLAISKKLKMWKRRSQVEKKLIWTLPRAYCFPNDGLIIEGKPFFICLEIVVGVYILVNDYVFIFHSGFFFVSEFRVHQYCLSFVDTSNFRLLIFKSIFDVTWEA